MSALERLYEDSPIVLQNLMTTVKGYQNYSSRYGRAYREHLEYCESFDRLSFEQQLHEQQRLLVEFVRFAYEHSPFYADLYKDIDISSIRCVDDLKRLPVVDKEMLRANIDRVYAYPARECVEGHTGGTTGTSLVVRMTIDDQMKRMAMLDHFKRRVGFVSLKMRRASFSGKHIVPPKQTQKVFWRYNHSCKQMIFSSFHITQENIPAYVEELNRFKPHSLDGFFSSMCDIADYVERNGLPLTFRPVAIFPTSETLTRSGRELLERVFGCPVYDQYASSEGAPFITECAHQVKHMELSSGVFEHLPDSNEVLVTSFTTHGTPLIRYCIGDTISFDEPLHQSSCACGNAAPEVSAIEGRQLDFLYTSKGARVNAGNVANLFKNLPNVIVKSQLIQETPDVVTALIVVDERLYRDEYDQAIREEFTNKFGLGSELVIKHVDDIPRAASGKHRFIINTVDERLFD